MIENWWLKSSHYPNPVFHQSHTLHNITHTELSETETTSRHHQLSLVDINSKRVLDIHGGAENDKNNEVQNLDNATPGVVLDGYDIWTENANDSLNRSRWKCFIGHLSNTTMDTVTVQSVA